MVFHPWSLKTAPQEIQSVVSLSAHIQLSSDDPIAGLFCILTADFDGINPLLIKKGGSASESLCFADCIHFFRDLHLTVID